MDVEESIDRPDHARRRSPLLELAVVLATEIEQSDGLLRRLGRRLVDPAQKELNLTLPVAELADAQQERDAGIPVPPEERAEVQQGGLRPTLRDA